MLRNFFKSTLRNLWKNKTYSFLNIFGLAIGIACAGLIFLWVENESTFNNNNAKKDRLYLVKMNNQVDGGIFTHSSTPALMAPAMQSELPGIANTCRMTEGQTSLLFSIGDKSVYAGGRFADPSVFSMFTLPFVQGNAQAAFLPLHAIVLTESAARKFFGDDKNVIGKSVRVDHKQDYVVTGILRDIPENASVRFEWIAPFQVTIQENPRQLSWGRFGTSTYVELKAGTKAKAINTQLYDYIRKKQGTATSTAHAFLFNMAHWRLYDDFENGVETGKGRIQYVRLFSVIAWIILFIACINFMNLSTARSSKRAREVGVRKVLGAGKKGLVAQFLGEALLLSVMASGIAVVLMSLLLPLFNTLVNENLHLDLLQPAHLITLFSLTLVCGLVAGSYPSLYLSAFNPVFVLKGIKGKTGNAAFIRKGLVVMQFSVSIVLIIGTMIIYRQIQHVKNRNLGFNKENLIEMNVQGDMLKNFQPIKQELINTGMIENVALSDHATITNGNNTTNIDWPGKNPGSQIVISQRAVSPEFLSTTGMHIREGRDFQSTDIPVFSPDGKPTDPGLNFNVVVTESMEKIMGKGSAIGSTMTRQTDIGTFHMKVTGVIADYVYGDMYGNASPVIFYCIPPVTNLMYIRCKPQSSTEKMLSAIGHVMKKNNPAYPFEYRFVDDQFNAMFLSEMLISKLSRVFAALAIFISCLGLFGLAAYTAERRTKEIGIRKVLGANVRGIAVLLSIEFVRLVALSCLVAFPLAWIIMHYWLLDYAYRVAINPLLFLFAGGMAIGIALLTVTFQAIKVAVANPVKSLRMD